MNTTTKTWNITLNARLEGIPVMTFAHTVTLTGSPRGDFAAVIDGQPAPLAEAVRLLQWAKADGTLTEITATLPQPHPAEPIGKRRAHLLHIELGQRGYGRGYEAVSRVLGYRITSLAGLVEGEYRRVREWLDGPVSTVAA